MKKYLKLIIIVVIVALFFVNRSCNQRQRDKLIEKITTLETRNEMLAKQNLSINKEIEAKDLLLKTKQYQVDSVNALLAKAKKDAAYWKQQHDKIAEDLEQVSYDDSYAFSMMVYPYTGQLKYLFNEQQVRAIHRTYLENENKKQQIAATETALNECEVGTDLLNQSVTLLQSKYDLKTQQYDNQLAISTNKDAEIELLQKTLKRKIFWTKAKNIAIPVAFGLGLVVGL